MTPATQGHLAMLAFSVLVAGSFSLGALAANDIDPMVLNTVRFVIACFIVGVAALITGGIPRASARAPWRYFALGGLFATYFVLMFEGLKTAPPVAAASIFTLTPVLAAVFGWLLLRQMLTPRIAGALMLGAVGALWVIFRGDLQQLLALKVGRGEAIYLVGCVAHAAYTPLVRRLNRGESATVFSFGVLVAGSAILVTLSWRAILDTEWTALPTAVWVAIFYTAVFASAITFVLLQFATLRLPASKVMAYTYLVPVWVIAWEGGLGQPLPDPTVVVGLLLTLAALSALFLERTALRN